MRWMPFKNLSVYFLAHWEGVFFLRFFRIMINFSFPLNLNGKNRKNRWRHWCKLRERAQTIFFRRFFSWLKKMNSFFYFVGSFASSLLFYEFSLSLIVFDRVEEVVGCLVGWRLCTIIFSELTTDSTHCCSIRVHHSELRRDYSTNVENIVKSKATSEVFQYSNFRVSRVSRVVLSVYCLCYFCVYCRQIQIYKEVHPSVWVNNIYSFLWFCAAILCEKNATNKTGNNEKIASLKFEFCWTNNRIW